MSYFWRERPARLLFFIAFIRVNIYLSYSCKYYCFFPKLKREIIRWDLKRFFFVVKWQLRCRARLDCRYFFHCRSRFILITIYLFISMSVSFESGWLFFCSGSSFDSRRSDSCNLFFSSKNFLLKIKKYIIIKYSKYCSGWI